MEYYDKVQWLFRQLPVAQSQFIVQQLLYEFPQLLLACSFSEIILQTLLVYMHGHP